MSDTPRADADGCPKCGAKQSRYQDTDGDGLPVDGGPIPGAAMTAAKEVAEKAYAALRSEFDELQQVLQNVTTTKDKAVEALNELTKDVGAFVGDRLPIRLWQPKIRAMKKLIAELEEVR